MIGNMIFKRALLASALLGLTATPLVAATTGTTGGSASFSTYQPSLALTQNFSLNGIFPIGTDPANVGGGTDHFATAMVRTLATGFSPGNRLADGRHFSIGSNPALFSVIGNQYGGNGVNDFAIPDLRGATISGASSPSGQLALGNYQVGVTAGAAMTALDISQIPGHSHSLTGGGNTGMTGGGMAFSHAQPTLSMQYLIAANGVYPSGGGSAVSIGQVAAFGGNYLPSGWLPADGSLVSISDYSTLFSLVGTRFGGNGTTNFALPDLRGRTIVGAGAGPGLTAVALGEAFGDTLMTLTMAQLPAHDHTLMGGGDTGLTGGGMPLSLRQPSLGLNYLIALDGVFPSPSANWPRRFGGLSRRSHRHGDRFRAKWLGARRWSPCVDRAELGAVFAARHPVWWQRH